MGAKASTANGTNGQHHHQNPQSPRTRTFSNSSSSTAAEVVAGSTGAGSAAGFSLLRAIPGMHITAANQTSADRQRARSLSSVPDLQQNNGGPATSAGNGAATGMIAFSPGSSVEATIQQVTMGNDGDIAAATAGALALGRVYTATSLPSHIWSLNGKYTFSVASFSAKIFRNFWDFNDVNRWPKLGQFCSCFAATLN